MIILRKEKIKFAFFIILLYFLVFQDYLQTVFYGFKYFDEIFAFLYFPLSLFRRKKERIAKTNLIIWVLLVLIIVIGSISNLIYNYQPVSIVFSDMIVFIKFFLVYFFAKDNIDYKFIDINRKEINKRIRFIVFVFLLLTFVNYAYNIWPSESYRFGIMSNQLFYGHPTNLVASCVFLMAMLFLTKENEQSITLYVLFIDVIILSSMRFKAIGACIIVSCVIVYVTIKKRKINITKIGLAAILAILVAWQQISFYYIRGAGNARNALTVTSFLIAKDHFPFGSGFGTFGSYFSSVNYSPIYMKYGISGIYGLENGRSMFISDTFWPMILGQFGFFGLICYISIVYIMWKEIQLGFKVERINIYISKMICILYLLISSTSESSFVNSTAIPLALVTGIQFFKKGGETI